VTAEQIASMALAGPGDPLIAPVMAALDAGDFSDPCGRGRNRLGGRPRHRHPFGALGDEHSSRPR
jgi:hypothetical protein